MLNSIWFNGIFDPWFTLIKKYEMNDLSTFPGEGRYWFRVNYVVGKFDLVLWLVTSNVE